MESNLPHYYVNDALFIDYDDALNYYMKNKLDFSIIEKTKHYR
jgi:hypothetical protein